MAILDVLKGINGVAASVVGAARGALEGFVLGGLAGIAIWVQDYDFTVLGVPENYIPFAIAGILIVLRTAWGIADQIDPNKTNENKI